MTIKTRAHKTPDKVSELRRLLDLGVLGQPPVNKKTSWLQTTGPSKKPSDNADSLLLNGVELRVRSLERRPGLDDLHPVLN